MIGMRSPKISLCYMFAWSVVALLGLGGIGCSVEAQDAIHRPWPTLQQAIGDLSRLSAQQRVAFEHDDAFFELMREPRGNDWLAKHSEEGQTVPESLARLPQLKPHSTQKLLAVLPLGNFGVESPSLEALQAYASAFFGMETRLMKAIQIEQVPAKRRLHPVTQHKQVLTTDILAWMPGQKTAETYAMLAVTMEDLYPQESWNYVFGQALLSGGAGGFSFARYHPAFLPGELVPPAMSDLDHRLMLKRSAKVLSHEMTHMFGLQHCVFYECLMNGSNHLAETDSRPMHLCPVCLRKLHAAIGMNLESRGEALLAFYLKHGFSSEAEWTLRRLEKLRAAK